MLRSSVVLDEHILTDFPLARNVNLLHYLITILERKYPQVLKFHGDLPSVPEAAKVK